MNVLVATLGGSWQVIPEILGFTNPEDLPLYARAAATVAHGDTRRRFGIEPVDAVWAVTTQGAEDARASLARWQALIARPGLSVWWPAGMRDIETDADSRHMADLVYRLVLHAHDRARGGQVLACLAGGRKTMSAELQQAGQLFGCRALLHIVERIDAAEIRALGIDGFCRPLPPRCADAFTPVVIAAGLPGSDAIRAERSVTARAFPLSAPGAVAPAADLYDAVARVRKRADALLANYATQLSAAEPAGGFRALYALPVRILERLRAERICAAPARRALERAWVSRLPKAELHCHLGGILSPEAMIEVAAAEGEEVARLRRTVARFDADLRRVERCAAAGDLPALEAFVGERGLRGIRDRWPEIEPPRGVCGFLLAFTGHAEVLDALVYGELEAPARFCGIGIEAYERLGDLQGSALLQSRATLRAAIGVLARRCRRDNVRYLELRCSPVNCTRGRLCAEAVVDTLLEGIRGIDTCDVRLVFIGSRHGGGDAIRTHVVLAGERLERDAAFAERFVGFDLAGAEHAAEAQEFRSLFRPLHERVVRITIHAGEGEAVSSIWQAVYELNADRIGHGLTLRDDPQLLARFRDRDIALEMCPSSNFQIVGFDDPHLGASRGRPYPLAHYLNEGLRVAVCTDDPGISRTDLSSEYLKAAAMTEGGLSRWQILQLVRNGFRAAFCSSSDRSLRLKEAEAQVVELLLEEAA